MKILLEEVKLFRTGDRKDGRTDERKDMTMLIVTFQNFANATKKNQLVLFGN
jgi:hypothetical protein